MSLYVLFRVPLRILSGLFVVLTCFLPLRSQGGGSGLNTALVINQSSTNSCELGNYYAEQRKIPAENVLRISWSGTNTSWSGLDFTNTLLNPLLAMLSLRQLTNQIDYVVLSMDIPFKTTNGSAANATTAALFYGLKPDTNGNNNPYAASEATFRVARPATATGYSFLTTMLTGDSLPEAEQMVDQGVASDASFPAVPCVLEKTSDPYRNIRYGEFDNAIFNVNLLGRSTLIRTNSDALPAPWLLGLQTGLTTFSIASNTFIPGAMADNLSSYSGVIFGPNGQTSLLAFIAAGASGSYGTVDEPLSDSQKFPNAQNYFYQARGFTLAESYYQSLYAPYLGLIVGEPLAAPFAQPGKSKWVGLATNAVLSGTFSLSNNAFASQPLQSMDLFVDGKFFRTITNVSPRPGNILTVNLEGYPVSYTVPTNATLGSVVTGLVARINMPWITNITRVQAFARGDRIELRSGSTNYLADPFYYVDSAATNTGQPSYRVDYLPFPDAPRFNSFAMDASAGYRMQLETVPGIPFVLLASTNLVDWAPIVTNISGGQIELVDPAAVNYSHRFYRLVAPESTPKLSLAVSNTAGLNLHIQTQTALAYLVQASTNFLDWTIIATNSTGASMDVLESDYTKYAARFYRVTTLTPTLPTANVNVVSNTPSGGNLVSVASPARAYMLKVSTNGWQWTCLLTNSTLTAGQVSARSSLGSADALTTFISSAQSRFMDSAAVGWRAFYLDGSVQSTSWLQLTVTRTNGSPVTIGVTNQSGGTLASLTLALLNAISAEPALQGPDGITWDDYSVDPFGATAFHLYARSPGLAAAGVSARLSASASISLSPGGNVAFNQNLSDLQPRNHLYITTGATALPGNMMLDTASLADGYHELTAVSYEGSSVATQTKATIPVRIQNTALTATLSLLDLTDTNSVQGTYHLRVSASTNTVSQITLFSTGGVLGTATNQSSATFAVDGTTLCAGLHPFYALVQTSDGLQYRTETHWVRLHN